LADISKILSNISWSLVGHWSHSDEERLRTWWWCHAALHCYEHTFYFSDTSILYSKVLC